MSADHHAPRRGMRVRTKVFAVALVLTALTILSATIADALISRARLQDAVSGSLERAWEEFDQLASTGVDPQTGLPFTSAQNVIALAMQRTVPEPAEGMLGFVDGTMRLVAHDGVAVRLEDDPEFVAHVHALSLGNTVERGSLQTSVARYEYIVVPVSSVSDGSSGAIVFAFAMQTLEANLAAEYLSNAIVGIVALGITGIVMWVIVGRLLEPLGWLTAAAASIGDRGLDTRIPVRGNDDVAELTASVNGMLDRLESAFASQRDLLDDVGHELKTPLTVVRGHLELLDAAEPSEVEQVRSVALDEVDRMDRLVGDIITLAQSERPDFVHPRPVRAAELVDEVFEKSRGLGERGWRLGELADVTVPLDRHRMTQALLQLAANAVKYSSPGDTIELGSRVQGDDVAFWVRDTGTGIAAEDLPTIFDRFTRGAGAAERADGRGLGLSIVRQVARAHGGDVDVASVPGEGSVFSVRVPFRQGVDLDVADRASAERVPPDSAHEETAP